MSFLSLKSATSRAQSLITRQTQSSGGSFATPQPLSTDVAPSSRDQASNTLVVERTDQVTQTPTESEPLTQNLNLLNTQDESSIEMHGAQHNNDMPSLMSAREPCTRSHSMGRTQSDDELNDFSPRTGGQLYSIVTRTSIQAIQVDQPADESSSLTTARQPDSSHLLQSTEVQQPADMSASLNNHQGANQPSSTIQLQSLEDAQQPHDDIDSI